MAEVWSAPGKMVLLGDYSVLAGGRALVAAVNRRAVGSMGTPPARLSPVIAAVLRRAQTAGDKDGITIDTTAFRDASGRKLGIGSSAAVAVVAAAFATGRGDEETLSVAIDGHREATGGGSGIDVAASFYGGVMIAGKQPGPVVPLPSRLGKLHCWALYSGDSASTSALVSACQRCANWREHVRVLGLLAEEGINAYERREELRFLSVVARYGRAMAALGRDAGVAVVTEPIEAIMRKAGELGGAAKPSGAGGGDIVVAFGHDEDMGAKIAAATGTDLLDLQVERNGLTRAPVETR